MINPTSCTPSNARGDRSTATAPPATRGGVWGDPFNATANCQALQFEPKFAVSTAGRTSKANGASLHVKPDLSRRVRWVAMRTSNRSKWNCRGQLPSRLTTLQKACTRSAVRREARGLSRASLVGQAKAITPRSSQSHWKARRSFVSNGNEAFPNLIMVLQGDGVTIDLVGDHVHQQKPGSPPARSRPSPTSRSSKFRIGISREQYSALRRRTLTCVNPRRRSRSKKKVTVKSPRQERRPKRKKVPEKNRAGRP